MSACEKCWSDAGRFGDDQPARYRQLLKERSANPCTKEEQAGPHAGKCLACGRMTLHQHTGEPMCGCPAQSESRDEA